MKLRLTDPLSPWRGAVAWSDLAAFLDNGSGEGEYSGMSKRTEDILNNAMRLSATERAELAAALLASLDGEPEDAVEAAWAAEIQRRVARVRAGGAKGRPWPEVPERLRQQAGG